MNSQIWYYIKHAFEYTPKKRKYWLGEIKAESLRMTGFE